MTLDIRSIRKKYQDAITCASDLLQEPRERHPLGPLSVTLLAARNPEGIPSGRIVQVVGRFSSGKTTLTLDMCRAFLEKYPDRYAAFFDVEYTFDPAYAAACGVDLARLFVVRPVSAEQALQLVQELIEQNVQFVVLDSVSALVPSEEYDKTFEERPKVASVALLLTRFCMKITGLLYRKQATLVLINQMRKNLTNSFGFEQEIPYGATALQHASSLILAVRRVEKTPTHVFSDVTLYKSKLGHPFGKVTVPIRRDVGIDHTLDVFQLALETGVVTQSGAWFVFQGEKFHGKKAIMAPHIMRQIREKVIEWYKSQEDTHVDGTES